MDMKKIIAIFIVMSSVAFSMYVSVDVSGNIKGDTTYLNYTKTADKLISMTFNLENIGSVTCKTYYRVDFEKSNETIYTAWSGERVSKPGDTNVFDVYWVPTARGQIVAQPYLYMCDNVYKLTPFKINVTRVPNATSMEATSKNTMSSVDIEFTPSENGTYVVVPEEYPQGWKFSAVSVRGVAGERAKVHVDFDTPFFVETGVKFYIVSPKNVSYVEVQLKKPKWYESLDYYKLGFYALLLVVVALIFIEAVRFKRGWKKRRK